MITLGTIKVLLVPVAFENRVLPLGDLLSVLEKSERRGGVLEGVIH